ncbi:hypothetical protein ACLB2K_006548 [Fragaria x ananassa]
MKWYNDSVAAPASRNVTMPMVESRQQEVDKDSHAANLHMFKLLRQEKDIIVLTTIISELSRGGRFQVPPCGRGIYEHKVIRYSRPFGKLTREPRTQTSRELLKLTSISQAILAREPQNGFLLKGSQGLAQILSKIYYAVLDQNVHWAQTVIIIKNELDKYLLEAPEDLSNSKFEILGWWKENAARYPILSKIAKDVFVVPASTEASESTFSLRKRVVDPFRASLTLNLVEGLVCLSDWLRAKGFQTYKEPTKDEMEMYEELEKLEIGGGDVSDEEN